ncbi:MAG: AAA family ATPase [Bacteroidota bacterium]
MQRKDFPLLYYQLSEEAVLGILLGNHDQVIQKDIKRLKSVLKNGLTKDYKRYGIYPDTDLMDARLRLVEVAIRPTYKNQSASFPLSQKLTIPIPVVTGAVEEGGFECYLPLFQQQFSYERETQFRTLASHFIRNYLADRTPEQLYTYLRYPKPQLDFIRLRVKDENTFTWSNWSGQRRFRTLARLAVKVPQKKSNNRKNTLPEVAWEREQEVRNLIENILLANANVLVVGARGSGKSTVIQQAIREITKQLKGQQVEHTFWQIMPQRITASSKYLGEWQEAVENLIGDLVAANGILWVDQIIQLLMSGGEGAEDSVAAFLIPFLQQQKIRLLGEVSPQELESMRRLLPGFVENFQIVELEELQEKQVHAILTQLAEYSNQRLKIPIGNAALMLTYRLLLRYYPYEAFPGKGAKFLASCINVAKLQKANRITVKDVIKQFIQQSGLPEIFLRDDLALESSVVKSYFEKRIMGQPNVIEQLVSLIQIYKAGLNDPNKPIASLLFAGPTGVGKTASTKALAEYFFGMGQEKTPLIRIDMSEFQHAGHFIRFIGYGKQVGKLVKEVREKPFAVILLDEVEKAHPSIFDALLGLLDEGTLTDHFGRQTNFRNTIIIMTSNLGASNQQSLGFRATDSNEAIYHSAIRKFFRPEFINRIDQIVFFSKLSQENVYHILLKELEELKKREGFVKQGLELFFSDALIQHLSKEGFDEKYGARPLQQTIERKVVAPMAKWVLAHKEIRNRPIYLDYDKELTIGVA